MKKKTKKRKKKFNTKAAGEGALLVLILAGIIGIFAGVQIVLMNLLGPGLGSAILMLMACIGLVVFIGYAEAK